jgi:predicted GIY-YIG superfamily endonuclease
MASPQEEYSYEQLVHYYDVSKVALKNYREKYPDLDIDLRQSEQDVLSELYGFVTVFGERVLEINAYLDDDEKEGIEIGTVVHYQKKKKREKLLNRIDKEKRAFMSELEDLVSLHEIHLRGLYLELSRMSAKFTAERIQELHRREQWVETQKQYLVKYYYRECQQYRHTKAHKLHFATESDSLPEETGVYILFHQGEIVYIGHSSNLFKRVKNHKLVQNSYRNSGPFELECVYSLMSIYKARTLEKNLIQTVKPEYNIKSKA